jgi:hypothetical protein
LNSGRPRRGPGGPFDRFDRRGYARGTSYDDALRAIACGFSRPLAQGIRRPHRQIGIQRLGINDSARDRFIRASQSRPVRAEVFRGHGGDRAIVSRIGSLQAREVVGAHRAKSIVMPIVIPIIIASVAVSIMS